MCCDYHPLVNYCRRCGCSEVEFLNEGCPMERARAFQRWYYEEVKAQMQREWGCEQAGACETK
jgi:hypothetical protein